MNTINKKNTIKKILLIFVFTLLFVFLIWLFFWPTDEYSESPGKAKNISNLVEVDGKKSKWKGNFLLMTVNIDGPLSPFMVFYNKISPYTSLYKQNNIMGNINNNQYFNLQNLYMKSAINNAIYVSCKYADKPCHYYYDGAYVVKVNKDSNFYNILHPGDIIYSINNVKFNNFNQLINYINNCKIGEKIKIGYIYKNKKYFICKSITNIGTKKHPISGLGILLFNFNKSSSSIPINVNVGNIGGPSAGLMLSLQIFCQLEHLKLINSDKIAGTGTIAPNGNVGIIGGIDKKVVAASRCNAKYFFAPNYPATDKMKKIYPDYKNNYTVAVETAKKLHTKMKIIPVNNFQQALSFLKKKRIIVNCN